MKFYFSMFFMSTGFDESIFFNPRDQKIIFWKQRLRQDYLAENIIQSWWKHFFNWKVGKTLRRTAIRESRDVTVWWKMPYQKDIRWMTLSNVSQRVFCALCFFLEFQLICHWVECVTKINSLWTFDDFNEFTVDFGME